MNLKYAKKWEQEMAAQTTRLNFIVYTKNPQVSDRCQKISTEFQYAFKSFDELGGMLDMDQSYHDIQICLFDAAIAGNTNNLTQYTQAIKQIYPDIFVLILADRKISPDEIEFLKKSGAGMVILDNDFFGSSRLEYVCSQVIRAAYIPVKPSEFPANVVLDFTLFHLMPLNQKLVPVVPKGTPLSETRLKKLESAGEMFIKRDDVARYDAFCQSRADASNEGLSRRCRARYLLLCQSHSQFVFNIIDQSSSATFEEGKRLFETCKNLSQELLYSLTITGEPWDVVNNSALGEFGSIERSPTIASYSGLIGVNTQIESPIKIMISALLCDLGMLALPPATTAKIRKSRDISLLSPEEMKMYEEHPKLSVTMCLDKKIALDNSLRDIVLCTHERTDKKGFPDKRANIPMESMAIQYCEMVDNSAMLVMGKARIPIEQIRKNVISEELKNAKIFSYNFLLKMKNLLGET